MFRGVSECFCIYSTTHRETLINILQNPGWETGIDDVKFHEQRRRTCSTHSDTVRCSCAAYKFADQSTGNFSCAVYVHECEDGLTQ